ncbi:MAG: cyclase family protein [Candidatus Korobacteraceae bacterium]
MLNWKAFAVGCTLALTLLLFAQHKPAMPDQNSHRAVIDLTHTLNDRSPNWEGTEKSPYQSSELGNLGRDGYYSRVFTTQEHYGTHMDAPAHFAAGAWTVDQIPAERLVRPMVILDVRNQAKNDADYEVSLQDVAAWEDAHGQIPDGAVVMAYTGWEDRWNSQKEFRNEQSDGLTHYPGFSLEAAQFLVKTRGVVGLGIDTMSVDKGATTTYPVHYFTSAQGVYHLENVANLALVPPAGATIVVAPIKLENGSGGPARVLALVK